MGDFDVVVGAGSLRSAAPGRLSFPHRWTAEGVTAEAAFTGAHLLHLAVAGCVLNDVYREADRLQVPLVGVRVAATGDFDRSFLESTEPQFLTISATSLLLARSSRFQVEAVAVGAPWQPRH